MDQSKEYINMCFKSNEIQSYRKKKNKNGTYGYWRSGDYYVTEQDDNDKLVVFMSEGEEELDNEIWEGDIWLPTLNQLKVLAGTSSVLRMLTGENDEQNLLNIVMNIRFNKVWYNDEWMDKYLVEDMKIKKMKEEKSKSSEFIGKKLESFSEYGYEEEKELKKEISFNKYRKMLDEKKSEYYGEVKVKMGDSQSFGRYESLDELPKPKTYSDLFQNDIQKKVILPKIKVSFKTKKF